MDNLYNEIATQLASIIPTDWKRIFFLGEVEPERKSYSVMFYFIDSNDRVVRCYSIPECYGVSREIFDNLMKELQELVLKSYDNFTSEYETPWEQMTMEVALNENVKVHYNYDVFGIEGSSQVSREVVWAYETFNYEPEAKFLKQILDKYLEK